MGNIGFQEVFLILVLALVVFGPKRLPDIARQIGKAVREVRKVSSEFEREVKTNFALDEHHSSYVVPPAPPSASVNEDEQLPEDSEREPDASEDVEPVEPGPRPEGGASSSTA